MDYASDKKCVAFSNMRIDAAVSAEVLRAISPLAAPNETRKRILRAILKEIVVTVEADRLRLVLHWQGGDHTWLEVAKIRTGQNR